MSLNTVAATPVAVTTTTSATTAAVCLSSMLCAIFLATNRRTLKPDFLAATTDGPKQPSVVGQLGLLYPTRFGTTNASFNETSDAEKQVREAAVVNFIRTLRDQHDAQTLPIKLTVTVIDKADTATQQVVPGVHNVDCAETTTTTKSWWRAKYEVIPAFVGNNKEEALLCLPIAFLLEGVDASGNHISHYGGVRKLSVEASQDMLVNASSGSTNIAYKLYFTLVDTNWENPTGEVGGTPSLIDVVASQQEDRCVFTVITRDDKPFDIFVSSFIFCMMPSPVQMTDDVRPIFATNGMVLNATYDYAKPPIGLAEVRFHAGKDRLLHFVVRSLPLVDTSIVWANTRDQSMRITHSDNTKSLPMQLHVRSTKDPLPAEVLARSVLATARTLDNTGKTNDKYTAFSVDEIMLRYNAQPRTPGDLRADPTTVRAVQFRVDSQTVFAQDATNKHLWYMNNTALHSDTTIDLLFLDTSPSRGIPVAEGAVPVIDGAVLFTEFKAARFGDKNTVSFDKEAYDATLLQSRESFDDIRASIAPKEDENKNNLYYKIGAIMAGLYTIACIVSALFLSPTAMAAITLVVSCFCAICAVAVLFWAVAESKQWDGENTFLFTTRAAPIMVMAALSLATITTFVAITHLGWTTTDPMFRLASTVLLVILVSTTPKRHSGTTNEWAYGIGPLRVAALFALTAGIALVSMQLRTTSQRLRDSRRKLVLTTGMPNAAFAVSLFSFVAVTALTSYTIFIKPPDACLASDHRLAYYQKQLDANTTTQSTGDRILQNYYTERRNAAAEERDKCESSPLMQFKHWWGVPVCMSLGVVGMVLAREAIARIIRVIRPTKFTPILAIKDIEDDKLVISTPPPSRGFIFDLVASIGLTGFVLSILSKNTALPSITCHEIRDKRDSAEKAMDESPLALRYDTETRLHAIDTDRELEGCSSRQEMSTQAIVFLGGIVSVASLLTIAPPLFFQPEIGATGVVFLLACSSTVSAGLIGWTKKLLYDERPKIS